MGVTEFGGEVVTLNTNSPDGEAQTRIWLRAGSPTSGWLARIDADPNVVVERDGESTRFRAVPVRGNPALRERIHALMHEKYTWANQTVSRMRDGTKSVPIRLDPVSDAGANTPATQEP